MLAIQSKKAMAEKNYSINSYSLENVRNRQETRVVDALRDLLPEMEQFCGCRLCVEDVYAIALNALPSHYVQSGSIVLNVNTPSESDVQRVVKDALDKVNVRPNHPD